MAEKLSELQLLEFKEAFTTFDKVYHNIGINILTRMGDILILKKRYNILAAEANTVRDPQITLFCRI